MKTMIKYLVPAVLALLAATACEDHRSDYLDEFQTMVYFRNGGEQELSLFRTGEDGHYQIPVCKSGRNLTGEISAVLIPFDEAQLASYNIMYETSYSLVPPTCYKFVDAEGTPLAEQTSVALDFGPNDPYKVVSLSVNTNAVSALQEADENAEYVMAFQLFSGGKVSADINYILLKPAIEVPMVSILSPGVESHKYTSASQMSETYKNTLSLNMEENRWDFDCTLEIKGEEWLAEYNQVNGTSFTLLPPSQSKLSSNKVHFAKGETEAPFEVTIAREGMSMLTEYAVPVVLTACGKTEFKIDAKKSIYLLNVRLDPDQIPLDASMVSVSHNDTHSGDDAGAPALVDDNISTFWHSPWGNTIEGDPIFGVYAEIKLQSPLKAIVLRYCNREGNGNGIPRHVVVGVSNDGASWEVLGDFSTPEMNASVAGQWISLPAVSHSSQFRYIRLGVVESAAGDLRGESTAWTAISELQLFGTDI